MPIEEVKVSLFDVSKCGYFDHSDSVPRFGLLGSVLYDLYGWINRTNGMTLSRTKTFEPDENDQSVGTFVLVP